MPSSAQKSDISSSLSKLSLDGDKNKSTSAAAASKTKAKAKKPVADSWEDDDEDDEEDAKPQDDGSKAPPPTPISPNYDTSPQSFSPFSSTDPTGAPTPAGGGARRPEKTDAVARRMIASALGVKVPKQTDEQKAYDKSIREQERKRREDEKSAEKKRLEEVEKAKAAIWDD